MSRVRFLVFCMFLIVLAGCSSTKTEAPKETPEQPAVQETAPPAEQPQVAQAPEPAATPSKAQTKPVKRTVQKTAPARAAETSAETAPATRSEEAPTPKVVEPQYATITSGTKIDVRLQDPLDSGTNKPGDAFSAILDENLLVDGKVVAARGSIAKGKVSNVQSSGRVSGRASMSLQLLELQMQSQAYEVQTDLLAFEAESTKKKDATKVGIGAGIGAVIGAIAGGGKGAAIGAAVGGGAGGATVLATKGKEIKFDPEHKFTFTLRQDVRVRLR